MRTIASRSPGSSLAGKAQVTPSGQARLALALGAGKAAATASRVLRFGGGTSFPGSVARRDPRGAHVVRYTPNERDPLSKMGPD